MSRMVMSKFASHHAVCMLVFFASMCSDATGFAQLPQKFPKLHSHHNSTVASNRSGALRVFHVRHVNKTHADLDSSNENQKDESMQGHLGSGKALKTLNIQLQTIQSQLNNMQNEHAQSIMKQTAEYEEQLEVQRAEIKNAETLNVQAANQTEELRKSNKALRKRASLLAAASNKVRLDVAELQSNVSTAMDFMEDMMNTSQTLLNSTELLVMKELDNEDMVMQKRLAREKRLNLIGMLQLHSASKVPPKRRIGEDLTPANLVQGMLGALEDYSKQKTESENDLETMFERRLQAGTDQLQALHDEYKQLMKTQEAEKARHDRLLTAVGHLEKTYRQLMRQKKSLYKFIHDLSDHK